MKFVCLSLVMCLLGTVITATSSASITVKPGNRVGNYACPSACPGPRGPYTTSCSGTVCLSNPTPSSSFERMYE